MFAAALGADVTVISHSSSKKADAENMGAKNFAESGKEGWAAPLSRCLDLIICTFFAKDLSIEEYISMLDIGGTLVYVGIPETALPSLPPTLMIGNKSALRGSNTGSKKEALQMLELATKSKYQKLDRGNAYDKVHRSYREGRTRRPA
jgi:alcohol dehydrogenase (NADP+)